MLRSWIIDVITSEGFNVGDISYVFCSDDYLLRLNSAYLDHNTYTDIITFDYTEEKTISGDIFISIDRIKENAREYREKMYREISRVMVHGVLHLIGYEDNTAALKSEMRKKEDFCLKRLKL